MAIDPGILRVRHGDTNIAQTSLGVAWQVYHPPTNTVIEEGRVNTYMAQPQAIVEAWDVALNLITSRTVEVLDKHEPISAIGDYSAFDADLILDGWLSDTVAQTLTHPICGSFSSISYSGIVALVNALLARVLGPTMWFWADSIEAGKLRVKCVAISGADSYNVYNGDVLLGSYANLNSWTEIAIPAGTYSLRVAAVDGGQIGTLSSPITVEVV